MGDVGLNGNEGYFQDSAWMIAVLARAAPEAVVAALGRPAAGSPTLGTVARLRDQPDWCVVWVHEVPPGVPSTWCDLREEQRPEPESDVCLGAEVQALLGGGLPEGPPRRDAPIATAARISAGAGPALALWGSDDINEFGAALCVDGALREAVAQSYYDPASGEFRDRSWVFLHGREGPPEFFPQLDGLIAGQGLSLPDLGALDEASEAELGIDAVG